MRKYSNFITLKGKDVLAERDGIWSGTPPLCEAFPPGSYQKEDYLTPFNHNRFSLGFFTFTPYYPEQF